MKTYFRKLFACFALVFAGLSCANGQGTEEAADASTVWEKFDPLFDAQEFDQALDVLVKSAADDQYSAADRARFYGMAAVTCTEFEKDTCSDEYTAKSIEVDPVTGHYMATGMQGIKEDDLVPTESFLWLLENAPDAVSWISVRTIGDFFKELIKRDRKTDAMAMVVALRDLDYQGSNDGVTPQSLWIKLARLQVAEGRQDEAVAILKANMVSHSLSVDVWQDKAFSPVWPTLQAAGLFDPDQMLNRQLQQAISEADRSRELGWKAWIGHRTDRMSALRDLGRVEDAEMLALETLAVTPEHQMSTMNVAWLKNELAYLYMEQGHVQKSLDYMAAMLDVPEEEKGVLIGNLINYSIMLWMDGRYDEALAVAEDVIVNRPVLTSDFGLYWAEAGKLCAQIGMGRHYQATKRWDELKQQPDTNYHAVTMMALCMDDLDFAAQLYIERLGKPTERALALTALSQYQWVGPSNGAHRLRQRQKLVAEREDVQAAVAKVGRLGDWPFPRNYWGEY